jgi:subtilase family serine protease
MRLICLHPNSRALNSTALIILLVGSLITPLISGPAAQAAYHFANYQGRPPIHILGSAASQPSGLTPAQVKSTYNLPTTGGNGTIAIIGAYDDATLENDLAIFNKQFNLPACTIKNSCLTKHLMGKATATSDWALEASLDVEWAHAIAPQAKILLVEAPTPSGQNLLNAIDYARKQPGVVAISMSWGGAEFSEEVDLDQHFISANNKITFFASSGDEGAGASWPAASPQVVAVGGTSVTLNAAGKLIAETAWSGSGGGLSDYEVEPAFQLKYAVSKANGRRAIPDVSYIADPHSGFSVYCSSGRLKGWYTIGGTSAGAPQWAAIKSLGLAADNTKFYQDKASADTAKYFRDIKSGTNGDCGYYCAARRHYDFVTGLGSPVTVKF